MSRRQEFGSGAICPPQPPSP